MTEAFKKVKNMVANSIATTPKSEDEKVKAIESACARARKLFIEGGDSNLEKAIKRKPPFRTLSGLEMALI
jgi:hypothetical protein